MALAFLPEIMAPHACVPTTSLLALPAVLYLLVRLRRDIHWREVVTLSAGQWLGLIPGLYCLKAMPEPVLRLAIGVFVLLAAILQIARPPRAHWRYRWWLSLLAGAASGATGAAVSMGGPPVVLYANARGFERDQFRGTFAMSGIIGVGTRVIAYAASGLYTREMLRLYPLLLPGVILGMLLGDLVIRKVSTRAFRVTTSCLLIVMGLAAVIRQVVAALG